MDQRGDAANRGTAARFEVEGDMTGWLCWEQRRLRAEGGDQGEGAQQDCAYKQSQLKGSAIGFGWLGACGFDGWASAAWADGAGGAADSLS